MNSTAQMMMFAYRYTAPGITFDGTNDYLTRGSDLTSISDGKAGTISVWINIAGGDGTQRFVIRNAGGFFSLQLTTGNLIRAFGANAAGTTIMTLDSTGTYLAGSGWLQVLASYDLAAGAGHLYVNNANVLNTGTDILTNDTIDYTRTDWSVGARDDAAAKFTGDMADLYVNLTTYIDLSSATNRNNFIRADVTPQYMGPTGALPTGGQPAVYLQGRVQDNFATNKGSGGGFTTNGTLTNAANSP